MLVVVSVLAPRTIFPDIVPPVRARSNVECPVTVPVTLPVKLPANPVEVKIPVEGMNDSFDEVVFGRRLPPLAVTQVG